MKPLFMQIISSEFGTKFTDCVYSFAEGEDILATIDKDAKSAGRYGFKTFVEVFFNEGSRVTFKMDIGQVSGVQEHVLNYKATMATPSGQDLYRTSPRAMREFVDAVLSIEFDGA